MINLDQKCICPHCNESFQLKDSLNKTIVKDLDKMVKAQIKMAVDEKESNWETEKQLIELKHEEKVTRLTNDMRMVTKRIRQGSVQSQGEAGEI